MCFTFVLGTSLWPPPVSFLVSPVRDMPSAGKARMGMRIPTNRALFASVLQKPAFCCLKHPQSISFWKLVDFPKRISRHRGKLVRCRLVIGCPPVFKVCWVMTLILLPQIRSVTGAEAPPTEQLNPKLGGRNLAVLAGSGCGLVWWHCVHPICWDYLGLGSNP